MCPPWENPFWTASAWPRLKLSNLLAEGGRRAKSEEDRREREGRMGRKERMGGGGKGGQGLYICDNNRSHGNTETVVPPNQVLKTWVLCHTHSCSDLFLSPRETPLQCPLIETE